MSTVLTLDVTKVLWRGRGLARLESGQVAMVEPGVLPGEQVRARVIKTTRDYVLVEPEEILRPSSMRQTHPCPYAHACGGSRFGVVSPADGLLLKTDMLRDAVTRSLRGPVGEDAVARLRVVPSPRGWRYRWRGQIHVLHGRAHAMEASSNAAVELTDCHLLAEPLAQAMQTLAATLPDGRFTIAASPVSGLAVHETSPTELEFAFPDFDLTFFLPPATFFQANWDLNQLLVREVMTQVQGFGPVADLFAGAGNFALPLASQGMPVLAVEGVAAATQTGARNARRLGLPSVRFACANLAKPTAWAQVRDFAPQAIIVDPPRTGAKGIGQILANVSSLRRLVWVSCDVVNTLRDAKPLLDAGWQISSMQLFDMFPGTWHIEVLLVLDRP